MFHFELATSVDTLLPLLVLLEDGSQLVPGRFYPGVVVQPEKYMYIYTHS